MLLREASCLSEEDARVWTLYGVQAWRMGRRSDAQQALKHALWLRERAKDDARARVLRGLLLAVESADGPHVVNAA